MTKFEDAIRFWTRICFARREKLVQASDSCTLVQYYEAVQIIIGLYEKEEKGERWV